MEEGYDAMGEADMFAQNAVAGMPISDNEALAKTLIDVSPLLEEFMLSVMNQYKAEDGRIYQHTDRNGKPLKPLITKEGALMLIKQIKSIMNSQSLGSSMDDYRASNMQKFNMVDMGDYLFVDSRKLSNEYEDKYQIKEIKERYLDKYSDIIDFKTKKDIVEEVTELKPEQIKKKLKELNESHTMSEFSLQQTEEQKMYIVKTTYWAYKKKPLKETTKALIQDNVRNIFQSAVGFMRGGNFLNKAMSRESTNRNIIERKDDNNKGGFLK